MNKHTQGPWQSDVAGYPLVINGADETLVARCPLIGGITPEPETMKANARLIAAAPELLDALETIVGETFHAAVNGHIGGETTITPEAVQRIYETARIALAKARGES